MDKPVHAAVLQIKVDGLLESFGALPEPVFDWLACKPVISVAKWGGSHICMVACEFALVPVFILYSICPPPYSAVAPLHC